MEQRSIQLMHSLVVFASASGYLLSITFNSLAWLQIYSHPEAGPGPLVWLLTAGVFVVWIPTVIYMRRFNREMKGRASLRDWQRLLNGVPKPLVWVAGLSFAYALINSFLAVRVRTPDEAFELIGTGHAMAFYAIARVVNLAAATALQGVEHR